MPSETDNADKKEDALNDLDSVAEDLEVLADGLYTRLCSDDIPWGAGQDICGEYVDAIGACAKAVKKAEKILCVS